MTSKQTDPKQNISREHAVITYSKVSAYAEITEKEKGTLAKGMLSDLTVLSQDIFTVSADRLPCTHSVPTNVDGKFVYQQPYRCVYPLLTAHNISVQ